MIPTGRQNKSDCVNATALKILSLPEDVPAAIIDDRGLQNVQGLLIISIMSSNMGPCLVEAPLSAWNPARHCPCPSSEVLRSKTRAIPREWFEHRRIARLSAQALSSRRVFVLYLPRKTHRSLRASPRLMQVLIFSIPEQASWQKHQETLSQT